VVQRRFVAPSTLRNRCCSRNTERGGRVVGARVHCPTDPLGPVRRREAFCRVGASADSVTISLSRRMCAMSARTRSVPRSGRVDADRPVAPVNAAGGRATTGLLRHVLEQHTMWNRTGCRRSASNQSARARILCNDIRATVQRAFRRAVATPYPSARARSNSADRVGQPVHYLTPRQDCARCPRVDLRYSVRVGVPVSRRTPGPGWPSGPKLATQTTTRRLGLAGCEYDTHWQRLL